MKKFRFVFSFIVSICIIISLTTIGFANEENLTVISNDQFVESLDISSIGDAAGESCSIKLTIEDEKYIDGRGLYLPNYLEAELSPRTNGF